MLAIRFGGTSLKLLSHTVSVFVDRGTIVSTLNHFVCGLGPFLQYSLRIRTLSETIVPDAVRFGQKLPPFETQSVTIATEKKKKWREPVRTPAFARISRMLAVTSGILRSSSRASALSLCAHRDQACVSCS